MARHPVALPLLISLQLLLLLVPAAHARALVVGSVNADITIPVHRLPRPEETITSSDASTRFATGGKGANQAIALARLGDGVDVRFAGVFGSDEYAGLLARSLTDAGVSVDGSFDSPLPSGAGYVLLEGDGTATSIVVPGANGDWFRRGRERLRADLGRLVRDAELVLLQREIPEEVNAMVLEAATESGVPVILDVGGEDRPIDDASLAKVSVLCPNESELQRLTGLPVGTDDEVLSAARALQDRGARDVLVTLGERGMVLVRRSGAMVRQEALRVPGGVVVDATGAGDSARAAFAVALLENAEAKEGLAFAAAAGAMAASKAGAAPSLPTREAVLAHLKLGGAASILTDHLQRLWEGPTSAAQSIWAALQSRTKAEDSLKFASRLNSMKSAGKASGTLDLLRAQAKAKGLTHVHLNYPQHFEGSASADAIASELRVLGLRPGAICMRYPLGDFGLGALTNPSPELRQRAVDLTVEGCRVAKRLGAREVVVWPQADGYDYFFQVDYPEAWRRAVHSFREICDECGPDMRVSLEWKPTDEISRFAVVGSTAAALLLAEEVDRDSFGLTLDLGHMIMAGENPAQSVAMAADRGKLFGVQLNDAHPRLGAEDGLAVASVNPRMTLEVVYWLRRVGYEGIVYFDTFPLNEDPVRECEHNVRTIRRLWRRAGHLLRRGAPLETLQANHDALGVLEMFEKEDL